MWGQDGLVIFVPAYDVAACMTMKVKQNSFKAVNLNSV